MKSERTRAFIKEARLQRKMRMQARALQRHNQAISDWLHANDKTLSDVDVISLWNDTKAQAAPHLLKASVKYLSMVEAAQTVNETLHSRMEMQDAGIDIQEFMKDINSTFATELLYIILNASELPRIAKARILDNVVQRNFPDASTVRPLQALSDVFRQVNKLSKPYGSISSSRQGRSSPRIPQKPRTGFTTPAEN